MDTVSVTSEATFSTLLSLPPAKWKNVTAVTTPVGTHIGEVFETMWNAVVEFCLIRIGLSIGLGDALCDDFGVALLVAGVVAVGALHAGCVLEEFGTESAAHDVVELLLHKLVSILLDHVLFALTDGTLTTQTEIEGLFVAGVLDKGHGEVNSTNRLEREPVVNHNGASLWLWSTRWSHTRASTRAARVLSWRRLELHVGLDSVVPSHLVGSDPARVCEFSLNLLPTHLLGDV